MENANVSDQIIEVLDALSEKMHISIDWTQQNIMPQVMDLMHRITKFEILTSAMWITIFISLMIALMYFSKKAFETDEEELYIPVIITTIIISSIGVIVVVVQSIDIIQCLTIPETVWYDYIKSYIN